MSTYRSTQSQRDAVQALRDQYPQLRTLTAPAVWRVCEAMRSDVDASLNAGNKIGGLSVRVVWNVGPGTLTSVGIPDDLALTLTANGNWRLLMLLGAVPALLVELAPPSYEEDIVRVSRRGVASLRSRPER